jgi:type IV fimbrial biogenesis protein FimT
MKSRHTGFTLIELLTALSVLAILVALAVPSYREFTRNTQLTTAHNDLVTAFSLARSEAIKRSARVEVCASANGTACSNDTDWATGWLVQVQGGERLQMWPSPGNGVVATGTVARLIYQPIGTVEAGGVFNLSWSGCSGNRKHEVTVLIAGSPSSRKLSCS